MGVVKWEGAVGIVALRAEKEMRGGSPPRHSAMQACISILTCAYWSLCCMKRGQFIACTARIIARCLEAQDAQSESTRQGSKIPKCHGIRYSCTTPRHAAASNSFLVLMGLQQTILWAGILILKLPGRSSRRRKSNTHHTTAFFRCAPWVCHRGQAGADTTDETKEPNLR